LKWNPQRRGEVGPPDETWRKSTEEEVKMANITWNTAEKMAPNRVLWRSIVDAFCSARSIKKD